MNEPDGLPRGHKRRCRCRAMEVDWSDFAGWIEGVPQVHGVFHCYLLGGGVRG